MADLREGNWEKELELNLPDSRLTGFEREKQVFVRARMIWEYVFCANCGAPGGAVTAESFPHVFFLCTKCDEKLSGAPPGVTKVLPEDERKMRSAPYVVRGRSIK